MSISALQLHVVSDKEKDVRELAKVVASIETCCFRNRDSINYEKQDIVTVPPNKPNTLLPLRKRIKGWIDSNRKYSMFEKALEIYENNQIYYLSQLDEKDLSAEEVSKGLTDLECWFSQIVEPHPKLPPKRKPSSARKRIFMQEMEELLVRENEKFKNGRSYYCDEEAVKLLDREQLKSVQKQLFSNYEKVKAFFKENEIEY